MRIPAILLAVIGLCLVVTVALWALIGTDGATLGPAGKPLVEGDGEDGSALLTYHQEEIGPSTDDLPKMIERRLIRVLVTHSRTSFFISDGQPRGFEYEMLKGYETFLNKQRPGKEIRVTVGFIPVPFSELLPALRAGKGDLAAANLTITPERQRKVAFTAPYFRGIKEVVVTSKSAPKLAKREDLAGKTIRVVRGSSYVGSLRRLSAALEDAGLDEVDVVEADPIFEAEDLLEMVNAGILDWTVVDAHVAKLWAKVLPDLVVREDLAVAAGGDIAWAVRRNNPKLRASLSAFLKARGTRTSFGATVMQRYYRRTKWTQNPLTTHHSRRLRPLIGHFKRYGKKYGFDWMLMAAQGFQESKLRQNVRSKAGAVGVMQLLPSTGKEMGFPDVARNAESNIHAGIKYMDRIRDVYFNDPAIAPADQVAFALAGYNAGPTRISRLRKRAKTLGYDPNRWYYNVSRVVRRSVGPEPVRYVKNIHRYYLAYRLSEELNARRREAFEDSGAATE